MLGGDRVGNWESSRAVSPETWGAAMDVPDSEAVAVSELNAEEMISSPGANRSTAELKRTLSTVLIG